MSPLLSVTPGMAKGLWTLGGSIGSVVAGLSAGIKPYVCGGTSLQVNQRRWGVREPALKPHHDGEGLQKKSQGFKLDSGDPTVQDHRGASGNVTMVEPGTRLAIERARTVTLHLKLGRRSSIPTHYFSRAAV
jgi:hypothetical protein